MVFPAIFEKLLTCNPTPQYPIPYDEPLCIDVPRQKTTGLPGG
jgi:hypothetical protein